jgi:competence protein ComEC
MSINTKDKILYSACFGFGAGVLLRSFVHVDLKQTLFIGLIYISLILFFSFILKKNLDAIISVFVLAFMVGILRFQLADVSPPAAFEAQVAKNVSFSALIVDEPAKNASQVKLIVETDSAPNVETSKTSTETLDTSAVTQVKPEAIANVRTNATVPKTGMVVFAKIDLGFHYGDEIQVTGKLEKPANFMTDQDMEFDYVNYLRKDGIFYTIHNPKIEILSYGHGNPVKRALFSFKEKFDTAISKAVPSPESIVLGGIILGERYAFSASLRQSFMDTGTIHIVTIGGYHVTLVAQWIMEILGFLPKYASIGAGIIGIFLYVIATGGAQTSIRAGIMATLALVASATGRMYTAGRALILAAVVMILINPFVLAYDVSFELSFMATIAIIFLSPLIMPYFEWIPWKWLRHIVAITSSMYVFALPFILYRMGNLSLVALPANILIVPLMPLTMIAGFVTGFAGLVSPVFAILPGKIASVLLYFQINAIGKLAHLPFAAVAIQNFSLPIVLVIYSIFLWIFWKEYGKGKMQKVKCKSESQGEASDTSFGGLLGEPSGRVRGMGNRGIDWRKNVSGAEPDSINKTLHSRFRLLILISPLIITFCAAGFLYYSHWKSNEVSLSNIQRLLSDVTSTELSGTSSRTPATNVFTPDDRTASSTCKINGPYPDHACTPGAIFADATMADTCVAGYTATVRNVSAKTKKQVFEEYGMTYPQPTGAYEVDHFIPLALGGSNDIANLFPEAAAPIPGFHEKDVVEVFLQGEVCSGRATLGAAQKQISTDWLAVYKNIPFEKIQQIKKKYGGSAVQ